MSEYSLFSLFVQFLFLHCQGKFYPLSTSGRAAALDGSPTKT